MAITLHLATFNTDTRSKSLLIPWRLQARDQYVVLHIMWWSCIVLRYRMGRRKSMIMRYEHQLYRWVRMIKPMQSMLLQHGWGFSVDCWRCRIKTLTRDKSATRLTQRWLPSADIYIYCAPPATWDLYCLVPIESSIASCTIFLDSIQRHHYGSQHLKLELSSQNAEL